MKEITVSDKSLNPPAINDHVDQRSFKAMSADSNSPIPESEVALYNRNGSLLVDFLLSQSALADAIEDA